MNGNITVEDFLEWANAKKDAYYNFFDDYLQEEIEKDADTYLRWANRYVEEFESDFDSIIVDIVDELEQNDYFGTEGFNKRFA